MKQKLLAIITSILQIEKWRLREIKLCVQGCIHDKWQRRNVNEVYLTPEFLSTLPYFLQVIMYLSYYILSFGFLIYKAIICEAPNSDD